nr:hypothetical protein [Streptomyces leeuwenhoekii]
MRVSQRSARAWHARWRAGGIEALHSKVQRIAIPAVLLVFFVGVASAFRRNFSQ